MGCCFGYYTLKHVLNELLDWHLMNSMLLTLNRLINVFGNNQLFSVSSVVQICSIVQCGRGLKLEWNTNLWRFYLIRYDLILVHLTNVKWVLFFQAIVIIV